MVPQQRGIVVICPLVISDFALQIVAHDAVIYLNARMLHHISVLLRLLRVIRWLNILRSLISNDFLVISWYEANMFLDINPHRGYIITPINSLLV
jgi:hypothetical protein